MSITEGSVHHRLSRRGHHQRSHDARRQRRRKLQALATGGLVLGVGASATLAAWSDEAAGVGQFATGEFAIEANTGKGWSSSSEMRFSDVAMFPGQSLYAPVSLRTTPDTTVDGEVTVYGVGNTGGKLVPYLHFRAVAIEPSDSSDQVPSCSAAAFSSTGEYVFGSPTEFMDMEKGATASRTQHLRAGIPKTVDYCFEVQLDPAAPNDTQRLTADYTWKFHAESIIPK